VSGVTPHRDETAADAVVDFSRSRAGAKNGAVEHAGTNGQPAVLHRRRLVVPASERRSGRRGWLVRRALLAADVVGLAASFLLAEVILGRGTEWTELLPVALTLPLWVLAAKVYGLYERDEERTDHSTVDDVVNVFHLVTVGTWLTYVGASATGLGDPSLEKAALFWLLATVFITAGRALARVLVRRTPQYVQNTVIVGAGDVGYTVARKLVQHPEYGVNVVGFVDEDPKRPPRDLQELELVGTTDELPELIEELEIDRVVIAFSNESHEESLALIRLLRDYNVHVDIVPRLFEIVGSRVTMHSVEGIALLGLPPLQLSRSWRLLKRTLDLALSLFGLFLILPALLLIAVLIRVTSSGPVLFRQVRIGSGGRPFHIYKFRTMTADAEERKAEVAHLNAHARNGGDDRMFKIPNDPRVTLVGRYLRRFSLDELPQLFNVVRGEMSLVGPRPLIPEEDRHVIDWGRRRLDLKPGITGPWQAMGASAIPFSEMVRLDYLYITNWSLFGDLKWIWRTVPALLRRDAC
jgi:exopolysaccharide biosynthesis polyprenyl glycosylphosphotransferase